MKIARITTQKRKGRYNIFLKKAKGEEYAFSVDEDILVKYALRKGIELDDATISLLKQKDETNKFYQMAINLLSYRMRSEKEIREYLKKKEAIDEQIQEVIDRLTQENYIDDQEFAIRFVNSRIASSSKGPLLLKKELLEKGVSADKIDVALSHFSDAEQRKKITKFIEKKLNSSSKKSIQQQIQTLHGTLLQKGYAGEIVKELLAEAKEQFHDEDAEKDAVIHQGLKLLQKYEKKASGYELKQKIMAALYRKGFQGDHIQAFIEEYVQE